MGERPHILPPGVIDAPALLTGRMAKLRRLDNPGGSVWMWKKPEKGKLYTMGVDTSAGVRGSDPCVAELIQMDTCEQIAEMYGWWPPWLFGRKVARLGWLYNDAEIGIETHPSAHGLACYDSAMAYGYTNLFQQTAHDQRESRVLTRKGWSTSAGSAEVLVNRVRMAVAEGCVIRSARTLNVLMHARYDENDKIDRYCEQDVIMALGIALKVRDIAYRDGRVPEEPTKKQYDETEEFWRQWSPELTSKDPVAGQSGQSQQPKRRHASDGLWSGD